MTDKLTPEHGAVRRRWLALSLDEQIAVLHRAKAGGADLPPLMIPIFEAFRDMDQGQSMSVGDDTTDEELDQFLGLTGR